MEGVEEWLGGQWRPSEHLKAERVSRARGVRARMHRRGQDVQGLVAGGPETAGGSENRPEQGAGPRATGAPVRNGTGAYPPDRRGLETGPSHGPTSARPGVLVGCPLTLSFGFLPHPAHPWAIRRTLERWEKSLKKTDLGAGRGQGCEPAPGRPDYRGLCRQEPKALGVASREGTGRGERRLPEEVAESGRADRDGREHIPGRKSG